MRSRLRSGTPTAHERNVLPLLPSGPGGLRRDSLRGAQPSTPSHVAHSTRTALEREFNPAIAGCGLQGTATSPSSTATPCRSSIRAHLLRWRPRPRAQRTESTPRPRSSGAASQLDPSRQPTCSLNLTNKNWRRGWDSNPRYSCPYTAFPVPHLRPLGHPSGCEFWRRGEDLNPRGTCAPIRFRVGRLQPGSATAPRQITNLSSSFRDGCRCGLLTARRRVEAPSKFHRGIDA